MAEKNIKKKKLCKPYVYYGLWIFLGVLLIVALVYGATFFKNKISGRAVLEIEADYQKEQPLEGTLKLSLKEGELIPASSKIIFETPEQRYEYNLEEFISDDLVEGNFYIQGKSISGRGLGYGTKGTKIIYPKVYFTLKIYSQKSSGKTKEEVIEEESKIKEETKEKTEEAEEAAGEAEKNKERIMEEETAEDKEKKEKVKEKKETPVTGNVITSLLNRISNFFLGLTGRVSMEFETEIQGEVSADNSFTYNLEKDQTAEIVSSSQDVELSIEKGVATVTTSHSEEEQGFGENYLGDEEKRIVIDLSELNLLFEQEELKINLIYNEEEIISLLAPLKEGKVIAKETSEQNITTNKTEKVIDEITDFLTDEERKILTDKFGNSSIEITKAELIDGRIIIRYELEDKWLESSYDSRLSEKDLELQMQDDRIRWLKDIANTLSQEKAPEKIEEFIRDYSI